MKVSVVICTYNRAEFLKLCLEGLIENNKEYSKYEIIVVDNRSTDNTKEVINDINNNLIRYFYEENIGLSHARNRGIRESNYDIIAFLDDDAIPLEGYINNIITAFENNSVKCAGGKITPIWTVDKPEWYTKEFDGIFTIADYGDEDKVMEDGYPYGANMLFLKEALLEVGDFNVDLGVKGNEIIMGEDDEMFFRFKEKGYRIQYFHRIEVKHHIPSYKIDKDYVKKRFEAGGKALARSYKKLKSKEGFNYQYYRWILKYLLKVVPQYKLSNLVNKGSSFEKECIYLLNKSFIKECKILRF